MNNIICLNTIIGNCVKDLENIYADVIVIDPIEPTDLVAPTLWANKSGNLVASEYKEVFLKMKRLHYNIRGFLEQGGIVISILRNYKNVYSKDNPKEFIGNYDWLWRGAGKDKGLYINKFNSQKLILTDYGKDSPFVDYLESTKETKCYACGELIPLSLTYDNKISSFVILKGKGKVIFVPPFRGKESRELFINSIEYSTNPEIWAPYNKVKEINPIFSENFKLPEEEIFENILNQKEEQIQKLEEECEKIHNNILQLKNLRMDLFSNNPSNLAKSMSCIIRQWGCETIPTEGVVELTSGKNIGIILPVICEDYGKLWIGRKLKRLCKSNKKGIIVISNNYNYYEKKEKLCSKELEEFAKKNNIAIISLMDIYYAHCKGYKIFIDMMWEKSGIVTLPDNI